MSNGMGEGGRPPKPTALKELAGTQRADRKPAAEPRLKPANMPEPPADLTPAEHKAWLELAALVDPMRVGTRADTAAFRAMVECAGTVADLRASYVASLASGGITVTTDKGAVMMIPEVSALAVHRKLLLLHFSQWGLTPAQRQKVAELPEDKPVNALSKFSVVK